jgi:hypothetical protein
MCPPFMYNEGREVYVLPTMIENMFTRRPGELNAWVPPDERNTNLCTWMISHRQLHTIPGRCNKIYELMHNLDYAPFCVQSLQSMIFEHYGKLESSSGVTPHVSLALRTEYESERTNIVHERNETATATD